MFVLVLRSRCVAFSLVAACLVVLQGCAFRLSNVGPSTADLDNVHVVQGDLTVNVCKQKQVTNVRASTSEIDERLTPATIFSLEQSLDFLADDELLEVTPKSLRLRKKLLDPNERARAQKERKYSLAGSA